VRLEPNCSTVREIRATQRSCRPQPKGSHSVRSAISQLPGAQRAWPVKTQRSLRTRGAAQRHRNRNLRLETMAAHPHHRVDLHDTISAVLRVANRQLSRFRRAFSPTCPYRHSTSVPSIRDLHSSAAGETRALQNAENAESAENRRGRPSASVLGKGPQLQFPHRLSHPLRGSALLCDLHVLKGTTVLTERKLAGCDGG
jgi:hypothetical protein